MPRTDRNSVWCSSNPDVDAKTHCMALSSLEPHHGDIVRAHSDMPDTLAGDHIPGHRTRQGGIIPGNLGTRFPRNPWPSSEIFGRNNAFLVKYMKRRNHMKGSKQTNNKSPIKETIYFQKKQIPVKRKDFLFKEKISYQRK